MKASEALLLIFTAIRWSPPSANGEHKFKFMSRADRQREARTMIRINDCKSKGTLKVAVLMSLLFFAAAAAFGQQQINLTAGPTTYTAPDGTTIPMWGYACGSA